MHYSFVHYDLPRPPLPPEQVMYDITYPTCAMISLPGPELGLNAGTAPEEAFLEGQVVKCRILRAAPDGEKLALSLVTSKEEVSTFSCFSRFAGFCVAWLHDGS